MKKYCHCTYYVDGFCKYWETNVTIAISKVCKYRTLRRKDIKIRLKKSLKIK